MNIAVIGVTGIAEKYALACATAGHNVYMAWKEGEHNKVSSLLEDMEGITFCSIEEAADIADLIIIATPPKDVREVSYWLGDVRRKIIIDATANVFAPAVEQVRTVCAITAITGSANIVKVFNARGYESLLKPLFNGAEVHMVLVGDSKKAKEVTKIFTRELGISCWYDFGGTEAIPLFNAMTASWRELVKTHTIVKQQKDAIRH